MSVILLTVAGWHFWMINKLWKLPWKKGFSGCWLILMLIRHVTWLLWNPVFTLLSESPGFLTPQYWIIENTLCGLSLSLPFRSFSSMITRHPRTSACSFFISSTAANKVPVTSTNKRCMMWIGLWGTGWLRSLPSQTTVVSLICGQRYVSSYK